MLWKRVLMVVLAMTMEIQVQAQPSLRCENWTVEPCPNPQSILRLQGNASRYFPCHGSVANICLARIKDTLPQPIWTFWSAQIKCPASSVPGNFQWSVQLEIDKNTRHTTFILWNTSGLMHFLLDWRVLTEVDEKC